MQIAERENSMTIKWHLFCQTVAGWRNSISGYRKLIKVKGERIQFTVSVHSSRWIGSVVQFYAWFKFYFPLIQNHYHTLQYPKKKKKKVKFEPRTKSNHDIGATTKPNRNKQFCPWIEECSSHLKINEKKISSVAQHGKLHYPWKKIYTKKENGGIKKNIWSQNI